MNKIKSPFRNYRSALYYLMRYIHGKKYLSNYEPTDLDWALLTLFESKSFHERMEGKK